MAIEVSVAICTYNRANLLKAAIQSVCLQSLPPEKYEIIVVDNASTDNTLEVVRSSQEKFPERTIRYLYESRQGLGLSRNTALNQSYGYFVAYLDDDARADPAWLATALTFIKQQPKSPLCVGGPILPYYNSPKPSWFKDSYEIRSFGKEVRLLQPGEFLSGSNMIWDKSVLELSGGFPEDIGVKGQYLSLGEETAVFMRLWRSYKNPAFYYLPNLKVLHLVSPTKFNIRYHLKRAFVAGQIGIKLVDKKTLHWRMGNILKSMGVMVIHLLILPFRFRNYQHWQSLLFEECRPLMIHIGRFAALIGIYLSIKS